MSDTLPDRIRRLRAHDLNMLTGQAWHLEPPAGHSVAWAAMGDGSLQATEAMHTGDLVVFDTSGDAIHFVARSDSVFVLGSGAVHPYAKHMGPYSVHTSAAALHTGQEGIRARAALLRQQHRL